ncbi:MAG TPA: TIGR03435 family protein [Bryobacteraceae bacterium]|nr:TIGR03435 family protein [Bryobacteraceae bacterium]
MRSYLVLLAAAAFAQTSEVQISPSTFKGEPASGATQPNSFTARGYTLQQMIARLNKVTPSRVVMPVVIPVVLDTKQRYDFALVTPGPEDDAAIDHRIEQAIRARFHIAIAREKRTVEVYVMTAPHGPSPAMKVRPAPASGSISSGVTITADSISATNAAMEDISRMLEQHLQRTLLDETGLTGRYDFEIKGIARGDDAFRSALRDRLGLDLTPARREIEMIIVTSN